MVSTSLCIDETEEVPLGTESLGWRPIKIPANSACLLVKHICTIVFFVFWGLFGCVWSLLLRVGFICGERGLLFVAVRGLLLLWSTGSRHTGFSSCGTWALERRLNSCGSRA